MGTIHETPHRPQAVVVRHPATAVLLTLLLAWLPCTRGQAQARISSAPDNDYLLEITQRWGAESRLGDLRHRPMGAGDVELRLWGGYGLTGTSGLVLRRTDGRWAGWWVKIHQCVLSLPVSVGDTLSDESTRRYQSLARRNCEAGQPDTLSASVEIRADSAELIPIPSSARPQSAWDAAVGAGVFTLPPEVPRTWMMLDGFTYVMEVRRGDEYRASVIEHTHPPETEADRQVQHLYEVVGTRLGVRP